MPADIALAILGVFRVIRCCCATDQLCANARCMSGTVQMPCSVSCGCHGMEFCCNRLTKPSATEEYLDSNDDGVDLCDGRNVLSELCLVCNVQLDSVTVISHISHPMYVWL